METRIQDGGQYCYDAKNNIMLLSTPMDKVPNKFFN